MSGKDIILFVCDLYEYKYINLIRVAKYKSFSQARKFTVYLSKVCKTKISKNMQ